MNSCIFFDFDGVIYDSYSATFASVQKFFKSKGLSFDQSDFARMFAGNFWTSFRRMGFDDQDKKDLLTQFESVSHAKSPLVEGMADLIRALHEAGYRLTVISSHYADFITNVLNSYNLLGCFEIIMGCEIPTTKHEKIIATRQDCPDAEAWYVGDTQGDMHEANAAGIKSIGVSWGFHSREMLEQTQADFVVDTVAELKKIFLP